MTPQSNVSTVTIKYLAAQTAGNLNVVVVGWNDASATVSTVTDTSGNVYTRAVGPTTYPGALTQSIYYSANIVGAAAGANSVKVVFSKAAVYVDTRILEYSGIDPTNPLDVAAAASGTAGTSDSGPATTTNANDLLVGANMTTGTTSAPGTGCDQPDHHRPRHRHRRGADRQHHRHLPRHRGGQQRLAVGDADGCLPWPAERCATSERPGALSATGATSARHRPLLGSGDRQHRRDRLPDRALPGRRVLELRCQIAAPAGVGTTFSDPGLGASTSYSYRVRAKDAAGNLGPYSTVASATTLPDSTPPTGPASLSASAFSSSRIDLTWSAATDDVAVTGYLIERCQGTGCSSFAQIAAPPEPG